MMCDFWTKSHIYVKTYIFDFTVWILILAWCVSVKRDRLNYILIFIIRLTIVFIDFSNLILYDLLYNLYIYIIINIYIIIK